MRNLSAIFGLFVLLFLGGFTSKSTHSNEAHVAKVTFITTNKAHVYLFLIDKEANTDTTRIKNFKYQCNGTTSTLHTSYNSWTAELHYEGDIKGFIFNIDDRDPEKGCNPMNIKRNVAYLFPKGVEPISEITIKCISDPGSCEAGISIEAH